MADHGDVTTSAVGVTLDRRPVAAHVTLIRPPVVVMPHSLAAHGPIPPIGLAYVAAAVRSRVTGSS